MKVIVIGAGIAGAAAARKLREQGAEVVVLEASDGAGGRTRTFLQDGFAIDSGAIFVMGSYTRTLEYLERAGHRLRLARTIGRLAIGRGPGPFDIDDLAATDDGSTLAGWARRKLGDRGLEYVVRPLVDSLTGADPDQISSAFTRALMNTLPRTQLTVPAAGMGAIADWLLDGVELRLRTPARAIALDEHGVSIDTDAGTLRADAVVLATDALRARELLAGVVDDEITTALDRVTPIPAHHVLLGYHKDPWPDCPSDLVVRAGRGLHHNYGALLNGRRAPASVPDGAQSVSIYFDHAQMPATMGDEEILALAVEAAEQAFGPATAPDFHRVFRMDLALIAPTPGHYTRMRTARDRMPPRLRLSGDYLTHSGIEGALLSGEQAADDLRGVRPATAPTTARA